MVHLFGEAITIKGGFALELRIDRARTTKDVDLRLMGSSVGLLERVRDAARIDLGDFMNFEVDVDREHAEIENDGLRYEGLRFKVRCRIAGKPYSYPFGLDIVFGEPMIGAVETLVAEDHLAFAGVAPPMLRVYPIETHIAEKLHAYTLPRSRPNTRVKDFPDLALLAEAGSIDSNVLATALEKTFSFRGTHSLPSSTPMPPEAWKSVYETMAREDGLPWKSLAEVTLAVREFLDPILAGEVGLVWNPSSRCWLNKATVAKTSSSAPLPSPHGSGSPSSAPCPSS